MLAQLRLGPIFQERDPHLDLPTSSALGNPKLLHPGTLDSHLFLCSNLGLSLASATLSQTSARNVSKFGVYVPGSVLALTQSSGRAAVAGRTARMLAIPSLTCTSLRSIPSSMLSILRYRELVRVPHTTTTLPNGHVFCRNRVLSSILHFRSSSSMYHYHHSHLGQTHKHPLLPTDLSFWPLDFSESAPDLHQRAASKPPASCLHGLGTEPRQAETAGRRRYSGPNSFSDCPPTYDMKLPLGTTPIRTVRH